MATKSITQDISLYNLPTHVTQAIDAGRQIEPQVNGRYAEAVKLVATNAVKHGPAGWDVASRSTGATYHINGESCTCLDAQYNAPEIAGRKACAHQVAAWIFAKSEQIARQAQPEPAPVVELAVELVETVETVETTGADDDAGLPLAILLAAAAKMAGVEYELVTTHIGGHGDANILRAAGGNPQAHESYLVDGDWRADRLHVCQWGKAFGQPDPQTTAKLRQAAQRGKMQPAMAYYLEATGMCAIKVMVTRGEQFPKVVKTFNTSDKLERAREFITARVEAQLRGLQNASPTRTFEVRDTLLPEAWRQRMGGFQIGKGLVIYAEAIEQPWEVAA